ncbi:ZIP family metal transporter [Falsirhodobacter sp. 1013]|uniref:ZIP family metal transporter n=1 Tax=Falsirhodobacter sp. 1013 TaxID=3417566 RepID=UPI003EBE75B0
MPIWMQAGLWGLAGASSLLLGAALAYLARFPRRVTTGFMAFGCGVLISAVSYDLIKEGFDQAGGMTPIVLGALAGSVAYTLANWIITRGGGHHRKRSGEHQKKAAQGGALAIAAGAFLDGIPESVVLGVGLLDGGGVSLTMFAAIFLSNFPEGLSSAAGMKAAGRSPAYVFGLWSFITLCSGVAALTGAALLGGASPWTLAAVNALAAGALLTMIADTMIPEAVEGERGETGLLVMIGFLVAFALSQG